ncbi:MAG: RimK/LysX family protein [Alphaproteobacteria bacterium]|nr:RimK/LysX family protein [Alphaproteobacteria bacterium]
MAIVAGYVEQAWSEGFGGPFSAKLDTGAKTSSINAQKVEMFQRGGQAWIRFSLTNESEIPATFEKRIVRTARIKRAGVGAEQRPVAVLTVCVAGVRAATEFTLNNRSGMQYPFLIGRSFLQGRLLVDSGAMNIARQYCGAN